MFNNDVYRLHNRENGISSSITRNMYIAYMVIY